MLKRLLSGFNEATLFQAWKDHFGVVILRLLAASMRPRFFKRGKP